VTVGPWPPQSPTPTPSITSTPTSPYRQAILNSGPISYWRLGETSGSTVADETGSNPGTYVNSPMLNQPGALVGDANPAVTFSRH
jgi:hypothetical protein